MISLAQLQVAASLLIALANTSWAQVPNFADNFEGTDLNPEWTVINPAAHDGFDGNGHYLIRGGENSTAGLRRDVGGQGDFTAEVSLELGPFFLNGSGGTLSDLKVRFTGPGASLEEGLGISPQRQTVLSILQLSLGPGALKLGFLCVP